MYVYGEYYVDHGSAGGLRRFCGVRMLNDSGRNSRYGEGTIRLSIGSLALKGGNGNQC